MAPELCDCRFSEYFSGREEGAFLERELPGKEPESLAEVAAGGLESGEQPCPTTHHPGPLGGVQSRCLGAATEVLVQQKPQPRARQHVQHCRQLAGI